MKTLIKGLLVLLIFILLLAGYILKESGFFRVIKPHFEGSVEILESPPGAEDLTLDLDTGNLFVSSLNRRDSGQAGAIYLLNSNQPEESFINLTGKLNLSQFRPHGISLLKSEDKTFLFVISHRDEEHVVERFEIQGDSIINQMTFMDSLFISPNDILAIAPTTFYITNDHGIKAGPERRIKDFLLDKNGYVVLYNGGISKRVSQHMAYANGINISKDQKYVFVTATTEKKLFVYEKDPKEHTLCLIDQHRLGTGADNIEMDQFGNLIIGAHPQMLKFLSHAKNAVSTSSSQILKVVYLPETDYKFLQEELYLNDGHPLSGSSVGVYVEHGNGVNDLFIGSVFESKMLRLHRKL